MKWTIGYITTSTMVCTNVGSRNLKAHTRRLRLLWISILPRLKRFCPSSDTYVVAKQSQKQIFVSSWRSCDLTRYTWYISRQTPLRSQHFRTPWITVASCIKFLRFENPSTCSTLRIITLRLIHLWTPMLSYLSVLVSYKIFPSHITAQSSFHYNDDQSDDVSFGVVVSLILLLLFRIFCCAYTIYVYIHACVEA